MGDYVNHYIQSVEEYNGFHLVINMSRDPISPSRYHRKCHIITADGGEVAVSKTKKEAKDLIDHGCFKK